MRYLILLSGLLLSQLALANQCIDLVQKEDYYEATDVCKAMAKKGDRNAQFALGVMYYQGNGMMSDLGKAQKWIRKAAQQNHRQGQYNLGIMLANGQGSSADLVEAYSWLKISAENGYSAAADSVSQIAAELSSSEKKQAAETIEKLKKEFKFK